MIDSFDLDFPKIAINVVNKNAENKPTKASNHKIKPFQTMIYRYISIILLVSGLCCCVGGGSGAAVAATHTHAHAKTVVDSHSADLSS